MIITQYGLTQASILPGPRVSPSGHLSRRCHPAPDPRRRKVRSTRNTLTGIPRSAPLLLLSHRNRCAGFRRGPQRPPLDTDQTLAALDLAQRACRVSPVGSVGAAECRWHSAVATGDPRPSALPRFSEVLRLPKKEPLTGMLPAHPVNGSLLWL